MSESITLADYRAALRAPGATLPVLASILGRLPVAMVGLALLLYVQRATGSFATAGLVSASTLTGVAVGSVAQGRIMDRFGPSVPLWTTSAVFSALVTVEITAIEVGAPGAALTAVAFTVGLTEPMTGPASRALWAQLLPPGRARDAGYSYEAISMEVFFILGPGVAGLLAAMPWPGTGVVVGSACMVAGSVGFAATRPARRQKPQPAGRGSGSLLGAIATPGMRTVALAAAAFGLLMGMVEVAVPAFAERAGHPTMGGLLLSVMSLSSVAVGLLYGMRPWPRPMNLRLPALVLAFGGLIALLAAPTTLAGLTVALLVAGSLITPQSTAHSVALELAAPAGTATEAFGWVITAVTLGAAAGQSLSGQLVEWSGPSAAFLTAGVFGVVLAAWLWVRRSTLRTTTSAVPEPVTA